MTRLRRLHGIFKVASPDLAPLLRPMSTAARIPRVLGHAAIVVLVLAGPPRAAGQEREVRTEVRGIRGQLRDNVLATAGVARVPDRTRLTEERVRALLARAPREVRAALEPFGYYEATVRDSLAYDGRRWHVTLDVVPGRPVLLSSADVRITGPGAEDEVFGEVLRRQPLEVGARLSHSAYEATKGQLATTAAENGYLDAAFDSSVVRVDREEHTARIVLHFDTGPRYVLGPVLFRQDALDPELLQRLVPWRPGDPFEAGRLLALQTALTEGPYFTAVEIVPRRDLAEGSVVPIEVSLSPSRPQRYAVGAGYGSDTGPRATFHAELRRLNRQGHRAETDAWVAAVEYRVSTRYFVPLRSRAASMLSFSAAYVDAHPTTSDTETWLVGSNVAGLWRGWRNEIGLTLERSDYEVGVQRGITTLLLLGAGVSRVRADDRLDPTWGSMVRLGLRGSHDAVVGDVRLLDLGAEARVVRSPTAGTRLRARFEVGALFTSSFSRLPGSIRYFAGGDRSVRGFGYRALGPLDESGAVKGGSRLLVGSVEAEVRVLDGWGLAAFLDHGNAVDSFSDPLETGLGLGIRWRSPVGMIRLDGAFAVSASGRPFRLHLNVGPEL